jgi:hypothetical protein
VDVAHRRSLGVAEHLGHGRARVRFTRPASGEQDHYERRHTNFFGLQTAYKALFLMIFEPLLLSLSI